MKISLKKATPPAANSSEKNDSFIPNHIGNLRKNRPVRKYLEIFEDIELPTTEGFHSEEEALTQVRHTLERPPTGYGTTITIWDERPTRDQDLASSPKPEVEDCFIVTIAARERFCLSFEKESESYVERSQFTDFDANMILDIIASVYRNDERWRTLLPLERTEKKLVTDDPFFDNLDAKSTFPEEKADWKSAFVWLAAATAIGLCALLLWMSGR